MITGFLILILIDGVISCCALALARSDRAQSHEGLPLWSVLGFCAAAIGAHIAGQSIMESLVLLANDNQPVNALHVYGFPSGVVAAACCAYLLLVYFSGALTGAVHSHHASLMPEYFTVAQNRFRRGDIDGAVKEYRRLAQKYPNSPDPLIAAAGVLESARQYGKAIALFRQVMDTFKGDDEAWFKAASRLETLFSETLSREEEAQVVRKLIRDREARRKQPYQRLQNAPADSSDLDHTVAMNKKRFQENPCSPRPLFAAAIALERAGDYHAAADILRQANHRFQHDDEIWSDSAYRLALLLNTHCHDTKSARQLWHQIIKRSPTTKTGRLAAARLAELQQKEL